jgi:hypothetical protein
MKILLATVALAATLLSCSTGPQKAPADLSSTAATPTPALTPQVHITPPPENANTVTASPDETTAPPVDFTYNGVIPDKESITYKIKVNTDKPISQVDIAIKYLDEQGKVVAETTRAWQNVVKSAKQPIVQGKTYEVTDDLEPGSTKAECKLKRVFFTDGSSWSVK